MEIGKKLKNARIEAGLTQEKAAEKIDVSRQTISNWENEKSYPDIISVIALSDLYSVSLDELLKGDQKMAEHLEESTNVVKSNKNNRINRDECRSIISLVMNLSLQQKYNKFALQLFQTGVLPNLSLLFDEFTFVYTPYVCLVRKL